MCIVRLISILNSYLIFLLLMHAINANTVQYFPNRKSWFHAQAFCNNLGGRLATDEDSAVGLNCNQLKGPIGSSPVSTYWTGWYKTISPWISKIGCYEFLEQPNVTQAHSVSKCYEVCRKQHTKIQLFAHKGNKCVCILEKSSIQQAQYIHKCPGSLDTDNNYWAYKVTTNTTLNGRGNCAFVDCRYVSEVNADNCATEHTPLCDNSSRLNWKRSQEKCMFQTIPRDLWDVCRKLPNTHLDVWLPIQRVAFWTEATCNGVDTEKTVTKCESFRCYHRTGVTPIKANTSCNKETTGFFCAFSSSYKTMTDKNQSMTSSAALCPWTYSYKSTKARGTEETTDKMSFTTIINQSDMFKSTTSIIVKQNDNRNFTHISDQHATSNIGLIVGAVLGALAFIGVAILVFILKLRRTKASSKRQNNEQFETSNEDHQRNNLSNNIRVNQLYEDEGAHADRPVHMRTKDAEIAHEQGGKKPNDVYAVVIKNNKPSTLQVGLQSVVSSTDVVESEYDRLNITPNFLADKMENNVYDSSIADRCESDPTYNTATNIRHSRINTEDVYN